MLVEQACHGLVVPPAVNEQAGHDARMLLDDDDARETQIFFLKRYIRIIFDDDLEVP